MFQRILLTAAAALLIGQTVSSCGGEPEPEEAAAESSVLSSPRAAAPEALATVVCCEASTSRCWKESDGTCDSGAVWNKSYQACLEQCGRLQSVEAQSTSASLAGD
jgi:hypothetical protein